MAGLRLLPHEVNVDGKPHSAKNSIGSWWHAQVVDVLNSSNSITSNEALDLDKIPKEIVVFGGGYIALEFAGIFNGFGVKTHLVYRSNLPYGGLMKMCKHIAPALANRGIVLHSETTIEKITKKNGVVLLSNGKSLLVDQIMVATGRQPNVSGLGLEEIGVELGKRGQI